MALTQITTKSIEDATITTADIAADAITNAKIANNAVTVDNLPTGTVNESILNISNAGTNGQVLTKQSGNTGGLTWADAAAGVGGATGVDFNDSTKIRLGTGNDAEIYFDSSNLYIKETTGAGDIYIESDDVYLRNNGGTETMAGFKSDAAVELYYDNSKKFNTTANGVVVTGNLYLDDSEEIRLGDSGDLQLYHNGNSWVTGQGAGALKIHSVTGGIEILGGASNELMAQFIPDGAAELYHNNVKKLETASWGVQFYGDLENNSDSSRIKLGASDDIQFYHNGTDSYIDNSTGNLQLRVAGTEKALVGVPNGGIELYYDGSKKFETSPSGFIVTTDAYFSTDGGCAYFGAGNDLKITHDGSNSIVEAVSTGTGDLILQGAGKKVKIRGKTNEDGIIVVDDGAVELYHDNAKKIETNATGIKVYDFIQLGGTGGFRSDSAVVIEDLTGAEWRAKFHDNDKCEFAFDNSKKLETTNIGITVTGSVTPTSGIYIGGTGGGNWLDDYEEGGFDATCNNSVTLHSNMNRCNYTKIGRLCVVTGEIQVNSDNSNANLEINNLPFACDAGTDAGSNAAGAVITYSHNFEENYGIKCMATEGSNALKFKELRDDNSYVDAKADTGGYICFSISYFTE